MERGHDGGADAADEIAGLVIVLLVGGQGHRDQGTDRLTGPAPNPRPVSFFECHRAVFSVWRVLGPAALEQNALPFIGSRRDVGWAGSDQGGSREFVALEQQ
jgi:hypothetical protein